MNVIESRIEEIFHPICDYPMDLASSRLSTIPYAYSLTAYLNNCGAKILNIWLVEYLI